MARKKSKRKAPKRIAGVKLPKPIRRELNAALSTRRGRQLLVGALTTIGAGLAATQAKRGSALRTFLKDNPADAWQAGARRRAGVVGSGGSALSLALAEAARSFADAFARGKAEADARAAWPEESKPTAGGEKTGGKAAPPAH